MEIRKQINEHGNKFEWRVYFLEGSKQFFGRKYFRFIGTEDNEVKCKESIKECIKNFKKPLEWKN